MHACVCSLYRHHVAWAWCQRSIANPSSAATADPLALSAHVMQRWRFERNLSLYTTCIFYRDACIRMHTIRPCRHSYAYIPRFEFTAASLCDRDAARSSRAAARTPDIVDVGSHVATSPPSRRC